MLNLLHTEVSTDHGSGKPLRSSWTQIGLLEENPIDLEINESIAGGPEHIYMNLYPSRGFPHGHTFRVISAYNISCVYIHVDRMSILR